MERIKQAEFDDKYTDSVEYTGININGMEENNQQNLS